MWRVLALLAVLANGAGAADTKPPTDDDFRRVLENMKAWGAAKKAAPVPAPVTTPMPTVEVRLPAWEIAALGAAQIFGGTPMRLTDLELLAATSVYQDAIDLDAVRVVAVSLSSTKTPQTWGNMIRVPAGMTLTLPDAIHELAHVWQYQTRGPGYLSNSLLNQACALLADGDRGGAYAYKLEEGKSLLSYGAEEQAQIIEDYFMFKSFKLDARYVALIAEARKVKAVKGGAVVLAEADAGLPPKAKEIPLPVNLGPLPNVAPTGGVAPQLEIRFKTPW